MAQRSWMLFIPLFVFLFVVSFIATVSAEDRNTAPVAITTARKLSDPEWQIAFISNTGVTKIILAEKFKTGKEALMLPDGSAGQWVIEFYKDTPKAVSEKGKKGNVYPFRRIIVLAQGVQLALDTEIAVPVPDKLYTLPAEFIAA